MITNNLDACAVNEPRIVVVGAGPMGLAVALTLARKGIAVLVLESGTEDFDVAQQALSDAEIVDSHAHAPMNLVVRRGLGGTSILWGGRCVPFDDIDFESRPGVRDVSWPISHAEVRPWYEAAIGFFDCGKAEFSAPFRSSIDPSASCRTDQLERWSNKPNLARRFGAELRRQEKLTLVLGATVISIDVDQSARVVRGIKVARKDGTVKNVGGSAFIMACGGIETTRLLLLLQRVDSSLFGGSDGPLGRYYMGHLSGDLADVAFTDRIDDRVFDFFLDDDRRYCRRRITVSAAIQRERGLLNMATWIDNPPLADPAHKSGVLSLAYLALASPGIGNKLAAEAIRRLHVGRRPMHLVPHIANIIRDSPRAATFAATYLYGRYLAAMRLPGFFVRNKGRRYSLHYHAEQTPNRNSRVSLSGQRDALGLPRVRIDLRFDHRDAASIVAGHKVIDDYLRDLNWGQLFYRQGESDRIQAVLRTASDGFHQIGTTRMSEHPKEGVVDRNCRSHDLANLFIAGSSVFPTSGQANPTLLATALAVRTAHYIEQEFHSLPYLP